MWWLIARSGYHRIEVLTVDNGGDEVLPVFSGEEEAGTFLRFATPASGWRVRGTSAGELISMLFGPYAGVGKVALDPSPEILSGEAVGLVSLDRDRFVGHLERTARGARPADCRGGREPGRRSERESPKGKPGGQPKEERA